jgi:hypothetical protein
MPRLPFKVRIVMSRQESDEESVTDGESVSSIMDELKTQMATIDSISTQLETHVTDLYRRSKAETTDWMHEPLRPKPHIAKWCGQHELPDSPTLDAFTEACFKAAKSIDLDTRTITFHKEDAAILWHGKRRMTVFDMIAFVPTLFE